jgi:putative FmdB family regulatory protein
MPIYEYRCEECGKRSTALLARFDASDPSCPHCGKHALKRQVSTFATIGGSDDGDDGADFGEDAYDGGGDDFGGDDFGDDF